jgi:adenine phosphoribosyltransferase
MDLTSVIRTVPDYPKPGIQFRDITTLLNHPESFAYTIDLLADRYASFDIDKIAGIEARGFIFASVLAYKLGKGFVPLRKKGKLPAETYSVDYNLEYGSDSLEIHKDVLKPDEKVLLIDDLLATGGTAIAGAELIKKAGGQVVEAAFIVDLPDLGGGKRLKEHGLSVFTLVEFEGD